MQDDIYHLPAPSASLTVCDWSETSATAPAYICEEPQPSGMGEACLREISCHSRPLIPFGVFIPTQLTGIGSSACCPHVLNAKPRRAGPSDSLLHSVPWPKWMFIQISTKEKREQESELALLSLPRVTSNPWVLGHMPPRSQLPQQPFWGHLHTHCRCTGWGSHLSLIATMRFLSTFCTVWFKNSL